MQNNVDTKHHFDIVTKYFESISPLSDDSRDRIYGLLTPCEFENKEQLISAYKYNNYAYFITKGITRSYWLHDGMEITTSFSVSPAIVFSMDEMYYNLPSMECVAAIGSVQALGIRISEWQKLISTRLDLCNFARITHQNEYRRLHRSHKDRLTLPAAQRYEAFKKQFPDIVATAPLNYIASYLGITLSTLSRLRKL